MGSIESRPGVGTVVAGDPGEAVRERQIEDLYGPIVVLMRDAVGLGVTEDELWERFDAEFERFHRRAANQ
jgi:hypothetical protein